MGEIQNEQQYWNALDKYKRYLLTNIFVIILEIWILEYAYNYKYLILINWNYQVRF